MKQTFTAIIQQHQDINGAYIVPPFDVEEVFGAKRVKVKATFDQVEYRGSLVRMGGTFMIGMTQEIRNKIGKSFGDSVVVTLEKDEEERKIVLPSDLSEAMASNLKAKNTFDQLSYTGKREYVLWITDAKKEETRQSRIAQAIQKLEEGKKLRG